MRPLPEAPLPGVGRTVPNPSRRSHFASLNGVSYQYPVCDRCGRDVVAFTWSDHFEHDGSDPMRTFFAACHGDIESVTVKHAELHNTKGVDFHVERAFVKALPEPPDSAAPQLPHRQAPRLNA